jgi:hypothetical protein
VLDRGGGEHIADAGGAHAQAVEGGASAADVSEREQQQQQEQLAQAVGLSRHGGTLIQDQFDVIRDLVNARARGSRRAALPWRSGPIAAPMLSRM